MATRAEVRPAGPPIEGQWSVRWYSRVAGQDHIEHGPFFWYYDTEAEAREAAASLTAKCPVRACKAPADVLLEGRWTCLEHMGHDHRPGEPFEAEANGMGESRVPRFGRKR